MALGEFELIRRFFDRPRASPGVVLGVGDDCAVLAPTPGHHWAVSTDMLVEGRHFLSTVDPEALGHKALAVNLSDLAACGATPRAVFLALALPRADAVWLEAFARGLFQLADAHGVALAGGDTTAGPLNLCITAMGEAPAGQALLRSGAKAGDALWVSGTLGDARLALEGFRGTVSLPSEAFAATRLRMERPTPRVALGQALRGLATSAIDVSDGLLGDLAHVLAASNVGAELQADALPRSAHLAAQPLHLQRLCTLTGGDDYELVFTAPADGDDAVRAAAAGSDTSVTRIGRITAEPGLCCVDAQGQPVRAPGASFDHFRQT
jgi:thiamine-monophosphate kinase